MEKFCREQNDVIEEILNNICNPSRSENGKKITEIFETNTHFDDVFHLEFNVEGKDINALLINFYAVSNTGIKVKINTISFHDFVMDNERYLMFTAGIYKLFGERYNIKSIIKHNFYEDEFVSIIRGINETL